MVQKSAIEIQMSRISGKDAREGDFVWGKPDLAYMHDILGPMAMDSFKRIGKAEPGFKGKVIIVNDHIFPPKDAASANNIKNMVENAERNGWTTIPYGEGIEHTLMIENGMIKPGMVVVGTDSHTVTAGAAGAFGIGLGSTDMGALIALGKIWFKVPETMYFHVSGEKSPYITGKDVILEILRIIGVNGANYRAMEIIEDVECKLSLDDDLAAANMTVEAGAKTCLIRNENNPMHHSLADTEMTSDPIEVDLSELTPRISAPYSPGNVIDGFKLDGKKIDQAYIGNCANGTISDLRQAASVLKGERVANGVKLVVVPATRSIYRQAIREGLVDIFLEAGATVGPSTCGACAGLHMGVLAANERCITNVNRNFRGRMGDPSSEVYLANTYVVAMSAVNGKITVPGD